MQNSAAANTPFTGDSRMRSTLGTMLLAVCALPTVIAAQNPVSNGIRALAQRQTKRSEEHTSELQSRGHLVCRLLLEKKKKTRINQRRLGLLQVLQRLWLRPG